MVGYGYVCGGWDGSIYLSTIDRFQFPFDSGTATYVGNLSESRWSLAANNSSTHGYVCGGSDGSSYLSTIDRFQFPFDSGTVANIGNLSVGWGGLAANNSSTYGYVCGGYYYDGSSHNLSVIERFAFPFGSGTAPYVGNLATGQHGSQGCSSSTEGYILGCDVIGWAGSTIQKFQFPFDSGVGQLAGNTNKSVQDGGVLHSITYGYLCGGASDDYHSGEGTLFTSIERIQFSYSGPTPQAISAILAVGHYCPGAVSNSTYGYVAGGTGSGVSIISSVERFAFPFGTAAHVGYLSKPHRESNAGVSSYDPVHFCYAW